MFKESPSLTREQKALILGFMAGSRIHTFLSKDGEFLRSFGCDGTGVNKLAYPVDICIVSPYIYVVDYIKRAIVVYTTEGEYVTSFGQKGSKEGDFDNPFGVSVDEDGFVYVCDFVNCRVQIF